VKKKNATYKNWTQDQGNKLCSALTNCTTTAFQAGNVDAWYCQIGHRWFKQCHAASFLSTTSHHPPPVVSSPPPPPITTHCHLRPPGTFPPPSYSCSLTNRSFFRLSNANASHREHEREQHATPRPQVSDPPVPPRRSPRPTNAVFWRSYPPPGATSPSLHPDR